MARKVTPKIKSVSAAILKLAKAAASAADAAKEPAHNFLDEFLNPRNSQRAKGLGICKVTYTLTKNKIIAEGPFGMSEDRFELVTNQILASEKKDVDYLQTGEEAFGLYSWLYFADKCVYLSKGEKGEPTVKVTVRKNVDTFEFDTARKSESLKEPGMRYEITQLSIDPTKANSPLSPKVLQKFFGRHFSYFLEQGFLEIEIRCKDEVYKVEPIKTELLPITKDYPAIYVKGDSKRVIKLDLYFDPSGKGVVAVRRHRIPNIPNLKEVHSLGIDSSVYASGSVSGYIDADFLTPSTAKRGVEENDDWSDFIIELDKLGPSIEASIEKLRQEESGKQLAEVYKEASELAREILSGDSFAGLALLEGVRKPPETKLPENGFDFIPDSLRIDPGKEGSICFKTYVVGDIRFVPDGGIVFFGVDNPDVQLSPKRATLRKADADENGIVTVRLTLLSKRAIKERVILTASHGNSEAEARIHFAKKEERLESEDRNRGGTAFNFQEVRFEGDIMRHSRLVEAGKTLQINTINPDYIRVSSESHKARRDYLTLLILKETFVKNRPDTDDYFEMFLTGLYMKDTKLGKGKKKN